MFMDPELKAGRITVGIHTAAAILMGWISPQMGSGWISGLLGIALLVVIGFASEKLVAKKGIKFWAANGIFIYLLIWLVSWTYFLNLV
jgi:hypothetical protein